MGDPINVIALAHATGLLSLDGFARLAAIGERRQFAKGDELMKQGDPATTMYVILAGRVSVVREHQDLSTPIVLAYLGPGEVVGEMGLLDGEPRSATVTAVEDTIAVEVPADVLDKAVRENPDLYGSLVKLLSKRLRSTDELVADVAASGAPPPAVDEGPSKKK